MPRSLIPLALALFTFWHGRSTCFEPVYIWLEGEDANVDAAFSVVLDASSELPETGAGMENWVGAGRDQRISGEGYLVRDSDVPEGSQHVTLTFSAPVDGEYAFWVRFLNPPPCFGSFNLWLDGPESREDPILFLNDVWSVWNWWGWGGRRNDGNLRTYFLKAGEHTLHVGDVTPGSYIDKILVTTDMAYVPIGANEHNYTRDFENVRIVGSHGEGSGYEQTIETRATGWLPDPPEAWQLVQNKYRDTRSWRATATGEQASAIINHLRLSTFKCEAELRLKDEESLAAIDFEMVGDRKTRVILGTQHLDVLKLDGNDEFELLSIKHSFIPVAEFVTLTVERDYTHLRVLIGNHELVLLPLGYPDTGQCGIGATAGSVEFDSVTFDELGPGGLVDFSQSETVSLVDWQRTGTSDESILWWNIPSLPECTLILERTETFPESVTLVVGNRPDSDRLELQCESTNTGTRWNLVRISSDGSIVVLGERSTADRFPALELQFVRGRLITSVGGKTLFDATTEGLLPVSIGFRLPANQLPPFSLKLSGKDAYIEGFPLSIFGGKKGLVENGWQKEGGNWTVVSAESFGHASQPGDGVVVASTPGIVFLGEDISGDFSANLTVRLSSKVRSGVCLRSKADVPEFRLQFAEGYIESGFMVGNNWISGERQALQMLGETGSWHDVAIMRQAGRLTVTVNGSEALACNLLSEDLRLGFVNAGEEEAAAFDSLLLRRSGSSEGFSPSSDQDTYLLQTLEDQILSSEVDAIP